MLPLDINNFGPAGLQERTNIFAPGEIRANYLRGMFAVARKIRPAVPGTKFILQGMLSATNPAGGNFCSVTVLPNGSNLTLGQVSRDMENWNRDNQRQTAKNNWRTFHWHKSLLTGT